MPSHLLSLLIFHNHFYRRKEAQKELQKAKLIISLFSSSLSVLTERVAGDVVSHSGAHQVPPMGLLVRDHRLPVHQYGNPNH